MTNLTIAFASCMDAEADNVQEVWQHVQSKKPQVLLLLGDSIYMDYNYAILGSEKPRGKPRRESDKDFLESMYQRYRKQWAVPSFKQLIGSGIKIGIIWDDHDFAWNNSRGAGDLNDDNKATVPKMKRLIALTLFLQFKDVLRKGDANYPYPEMPTEQDILRTEEAGIQESFDVNGVRFIMLDGRTFREDLNNDNTSTLHGEAQLAWLHQQIASWNGPKVIGSGSVLCKAKILANKKLFSLSKLWLKTGERWEQYRDYQWLLDQAFEQTIVLSGDIHENVAPILHRQKPALYEAISSGAARPGFVGIDGNINKYGILTLGEVNTVELFKKDHSESKTPLVW